MAVIYFNYGGHYSRDGDEVKWISRGSLYALTCKRTSVDDITYSMLVEKICSKVGVHESTTKLKLSYIPKVLDAHMEAYIYDDDDVYAYLTSMGKDQCRSLLHVEVLEDVGEDSRLDKRSSYAGASGRGSNTANEGALAIYEPMENVAADGDYVSQPDTNGEGQNVSNNVETGMGAFVDHVELPRVSQDSQYVEAWEDGLGFVVGQEFESKQIVQDLVERASHQYCFGFSVVNSDTKRYVVKCRVAKEGCTWYLRVVKLANSTRFSVRVYRNMHLCSRSSSTSANRRKGTPRLVASILHEDYPGQFDTPTPKSIINLVQGKVGVEVSYSTALRGKKQAITDVRGSPEDSFKNLPSYLYMLEMVNPGTHTRLVLDEENKFKYLFFALGASIEGFQVMRKVIIVDATFLKTIHRGILIVATAQDPNRHVYPLAFAIADGEKDDSWTWFFETLKTCIPDSKELVFVSDRHKSIIKAVGNVYPMSQHGYCIFHMSQNVKLKVRHQDRELVVSKFMEVAQTYTQVEFGKKFDDLCSRYPSLGVYLGKSTEFPKWARSYFPGERYDIDTSNCAESINSAFRSARAYSLLPMIDEIVLRMSEWFNKYRQEAVSGSEVQKLVPFVENKIHERCEPALKLSVSELNSFQLEYVVYGRDGITYVVNLRTKSCSCKCFDIDKYPCVHGIAAFMKYKKSHTETEIHEVQDLCSRYYLVELWAMAYYKTIYPVPHMNDWIIPDHIRESVVFPPEYTKKQGRIQETRFPSVGERRKKSRRVKGRNLGRWFGVDEESGSQH